MTEKPWMMIITAALQEPNTISNKTVEVGFKSIGKCIQILSLKYTTTLSPKKQMPSQD